MGAAQACGRQQDPPARSDRAFRDSGLVGVYLRKFELSARQALFGSGQQPPNGLRSIAFGSVTAIVQSVFVNDSEIIFPRCELSGGPVNTWLGLEKIVAHCIQACHPKAGGLADNHRHGNAAERASSTRAAALRCRRSGWARRYWTTTSVI